VDFFNKKLNYCSESKTKGDKAMLKRFLIAVFAVFSLLTFGTFDSHSNNAECQNYYEQHYIGCVLYIFEYTCDGLLIRIYPAEE
jgi:hypothetical protein